MDGLPEGKEEVRWSSSACDGGREKARGWKKVQERPEHSEVAHTPNHSALMTDAELLGDGGQQRR